MAYLVWILPHRRFIETVIARKNLLGPFPKLQGEGAQALSHKAPAFLLCTSHWDWSFTSTIQHTQLEKCRFIATMKCHDGWPAISMWSCCFALQCIRKIWSYLSQSTIWLLITVALTVFYHSNFLAGLPVYTMMVQNIEVHSVFNTQKMTGHSKSHCLPLAAYWNGAHSNIWLWAQVYASSLQLCMLLPSILSIQTKCFQSMGIPLYLQESLQD